MAKIKLKPVKSLEHLYELLTNGIHEYAIALQHGLISKKNIYRSRSKFEVENCIDDSNQKLTENQLLDREYTNVGYALSTGALYYYPIELTNKYENTHRK